MDTSEVFLTKYLKKELIMALPYPTQREFCRKYNLYPSKSKSTSKKSIRKNNTDLSEDEPEVIPGDTYVDADVESKVEVDVFLSDYGSAINHSNSDSDDYEGESKAEIEAFISFFAKVRQEVEEDFVKKKTNFQFKPETFN